MLLNLDLTVFPSTAARYTPSSYCVLMVALLGKPYVDSCAAIVAIVLLQLGEQEIIPLACST